MRRDAVDWILFATQLASVAVGAAAAWLAAVTIRATKTQAKQSQDALLRERRIDFELGVLRDLAEYNLKGHSVSWASEMFTVLAAMLPADLVPLARACVKLGSTPEAQAVCDGTILRNVVLRDHFRADIQVEILAAVAHLKDQRG